MTVSEFIEVAKIMGWTVSQDHNVFQSFPFCRSCIVRQVYVSMPQTGDRWVQRRALFVPIPGQPYSKRFMTEMRKANEKVFALIPEASDSGFVAAMRYCT